MKNTKKRTPEEQALWDKLNQLRASRTEMVFARNRTTAALHALTEDAEDAAVLQVARAAISASWKLERLDADISTIETEYKRLRG